jgi:hypothetical protein
MGLDLVLVRLDPREPSIMVGDAQLTAVLEGSVLEAPLSKSLGSHPGVQEVGVHISVERTKIMMHRDEQRAIWMISHEAEGAFYKPDQPCGASLERQSRRLWPSRVLSEQVKAN